jgi:hypothetical protein
LHIDKDTAINCTGIFWEGRFKSQALLDEQALMACMAYVDQQAESLLPFAGNPRKEMPKGLPFCLLDYIELVDWTGRCIRNDKRGAIDSNLPGALERLKIEPKHWMYLTQNFESQFKTLVGTAFQIKDAASKLGYQRTPGISKCIQLTV